MMKLKTDHDSHHPTEKEKEEVSTNAKVPPKNRPPFTPEQMEQKQYFTRKNIRLYKSFNPLEEPTIQWIPENYTFPFAEQKGGIPTPVTVQEYYHRRYGLQLQYPKMPLVRVPPSKDNKTKFVEYYPLEFLYSTLELVKNMNTTEQILEALKLHDEFAGNGRIEHITSILLQNDDADNSKTQQNNSAPKKELRTFQQQQQEILAHQFQMTVQSEPLTLAARGTLERWWGHVREPLLFYCDPTY
jgi:hypothetical protein